MKPVFFRKKSTLIKDIATVVVYEKSEAPVLVGTKPRNNLIPMESAFSCYTGILRANHTPVVSVAVGNVKDTIPVSIKSFRGDSFLHYWPYSR